VIPAIKGTGAVRYSFIVRGIIGSMTFSHLKGKTKEIKASKA
jgi:hypothetical protein